MPQVLHLIMANTPQLNQSKGKRSEEIWHYGLAKTSLFTLGMLAFLDRAGMENDVTW